MEELLKHDLEEAMFFSYIPGLIIRMPITDINVSDAGLTFELGDEDSSITIWKDISEVRKVERPNNFNGEYEFCYIVKNEYKDTIGYIGKLC